MTNNFMTKSAIARKKRNTAICIEYHNTMKQHPMASVMMVRQWLADKYNMSASSVANIVKNNGTNTAQR